MMREWMMLEWSDYYRMMRSWWEEEQRCVHLVWVCGKKDEWVCGNYAANHTKL